MKSNSRDTSVLFADLQTQLADIRARASGPVWGDGYSVKHPCQDSRNVADQGPKPGCVGTAPPSESLVPQGTSSATNAADSILSTDRSLGQNRMDPGRRVDEGARTSPSAYVRPSTDGVHGDTAPRGPSDSAEWRGDVLARASGNDTPPGGGRQPLQPDTFGRAGTGDNAA